METFPYVFSLGNVSKAGPSKEVIKQSWFKMTLVGKGWSGREDTAKDTDLKEKPNRYISQTFYIAQYYTQFYIAKKAYFLGFSRVITVASKYLLAEIAICLPKIIQRTMIFCQKPYNKFGSSPFSLLLIKHNSLIRCFFGRIDLAMNLLAGKIS